MLLVSILQLKQQLLLQGGSAKSIAERLSLSPNTVQGHIQNLYGKLGVNKKDQATGLFAVKACVNAPDESLLTGCSVKVIAETYSQDNALLIPYDAVYYDDSQPYVYVAVNNIVERRDIETGIFDENTMTVMSGLTAEDQLITSWSANLRDGAEISILTDEQTAETAMVPEDTSEEDSAATEDALTASEE